jgi:hypothetical protein
MRKCFRFVIFCILLMSASRSVLAFSCDGRIVSPGDSKFDVVTKCGEPALKDSHEEQLTERLDDTTKRKTIVTVEAWTYNFGPQSFLRILEFRNGKLAEIRTGGYGYADTKERAALCDEQKVRKGDTKLDVLIQCGEPVEGGSNREMIEEVDGGVKRKVSVNIEEWTYNLGPNRFMRIFTFRNGRLVDIKTGDYGK